MRPTFAYGSLVSFSYVCVPPAARDEVVERLAMMGPAPVEVIERVVKVLRQRAGPQPARALRARRVQQRARFDARAMRAVNRVAAGIIGAFGALALGGGLLAGDH